MSVVRFGIYPSWRCCRSLSTACISELTECSCASAECSTENHLKGGGGDPARGSFEWFQYCSLNLTFQVLRVQSTAEDGGHTGITGDICSVLENVTAADGTAVYGDGNLMEGAVKLLVTMLSVHTCDALLVSSAVGALWGIVCWASEAEGCNAMCITRMLIRVFFVGMEHLC